MQTNQTQNNTTTNMKIKLIRRVGHTTSAQVVASIDDLLTQILLRLPIKSLIRFKLVSKNWHYLITNPKFCHLRNPNPNPALGLLLPCANRRVSPSYEFVPFFFQNPTKPPFKRLHFTNDPSGIIILQSCNGLLLCRSFRARDCNFEYYVYNPVTKHFTTLPQRDQESGTIKKICGMNLAFDPAKSPHYKVVCVQESGLNQDGLYEYQIEVYSSETGPWKVSTQPFTANVYFDKGVYWNGSIHWLGDWGMDSIYFVIDEEMVEMLPMPPIINEPDARRDYYLGESCDHLNFFETFFQEIEFNVFEMKRDYSDWFVKYRVDLSPLVTTFPGMTRSDLNPMDWNYYIFSVFCLIRGEKDEDAFLVLQIPGKAIRYNHVYKTFEVTHDFEDAEVEDSLRFPWNISGLQYIESLCCV